MSGSTMVCGWIECDFEAVSHLERVAREAWFKGWDHLFDCSLIDLYWQGWHFPARPIGWLSVVTYGANVNSKSVFIIRDCIEQLAQAKLDARGCFFVASGEDEIYRRWRFEETGLFEDFEHPPIFEEP